MLERNTTPQFCIITPTKYLFYAEQSDMHIVLAHLVDTDEEYAKFYAKNNDYKIMDNGAFELGESYAPDKLVELAQKCKADAIVLPDYPGKKAEKTIEAAEEQIMDMYKGMNPVIAVHGIVDKYRTYYVTFDSLD